MSRGFAAVPAGRYLSNQLTVGEEIFSRETINTANVPLSSGTMRLTYFTCRKSETTTQVRVWSGTTAAGPTPTLCRVGLWLIDADGTGSLVASTANDTSLLAAATTAYTKAWQAPYSKVSGRRYALGVLVVTGATVPNLSGTALNLSAEAAEEPRLSAQVGGLSDLPASLSAAPSSSNVRPYAAILP